MFIGIVLLLGMIVFFLRDVRKNDVWNARFVELPTSLQIYKEVEEEDEGYSDEILRRLTAETNIDQGVKKVSIMMVIDLEEVRDYSMWTSSSYDSDVVRADLTCINFIDGTKLISTLPYHEFDRYFNNYLSQKSIYLPNIKDLFTNDSSQ
jgi:hypothetical protein